MSVVRSRRTYLMVELTKNRDSTIGEIVLSSSLTTNTHSADLIKYLPLTEQINVHSYKLVL